MIRDLIRKVFARKFFSYENSYFYRIFVKGKSIRMRRDGDGVYRRDNTKSKTQKWNFMRWRGGGNNGG